MTTEEFAKIAAAKQAAYAEQRRLRREGWFQSDAEEFCARKEIDPASGKFLAQCTVANVR